MSRVVVITGGSAGVGRAAARQFARGGAAVAVLAREPGRLETTREELVRLGAAGASVHSVDVADAAAVDAAAGEIEDRLGAIDVWVNCAMSAVLAPVHETSAEEFRRVTEVTYLGQVNGTLAALRRMRPRDRGVIVQVGSALAYRAIPLQATYCGAKHAIRGFTDALRTELMHDGSGVRVTTVHLPGLNTPQFDWVRTTLRRQPRPVAPVYQPEIAADAIVWASEHARREVWVAPSTVITIIGSKLAPGIADRYLARKSVEGQQTPEPIGSDRPDYLYEPVHRDPGAHGRFDSEAKDRSLGWWATKHRPKLAALLPAAAVGAAAGLVAWRVRD